LDKSLKKTFKERLSLWRERNSGRLPDNIIVYRDGVSEGQFSQVLDHELPWMRDACTELYPANKKPNFSIIVSVKRHQTRFYPTDEKHMTSSRNVRSGTVVDRGVTLTKTWDFFLTAHQALQGTARPAHYTVLLDEVFRAKFKAEAANELQKLTHEMCYLFGRATKAVSICPPAYYADILCTRQRVYMSDVFDPSDSQSESTETMNEQIVNASSRTVHDRLKNTMYYI
jgi:eukaryotic translation initiation factor 2C